MDPVIIHRCFNDIEADQIRTLLEENGIACQVVSNVPHTVFPFTLDGLGEVRIAVAAEEADRAIEIIQGYLAEGEIETIPEDEGTTGATADE
jgi:hypothetical protein